MCRSVDYDEIEILDLYELHESAEPVAKEIGVSTQTVYRVLEKHGVKRTHRHERTNQKKYRPNGCNTKYCPALVVMLRTVANMRHSEIVLETGYTSSAVGNIITKRGLNDTRLRRDISEAEIDEIEAEYLAGATTYELGEKYGVHHATISKWMKQRGHVRGKGSYNDQTRDESADAFKMWVAENNGDRFTVLEYTDRKHVTIQCNDCGAVFARQARRSTGIRCQTCYERYMSENPPKRHRRNDANIRRRARKYGAEYEHGITLRKVFDRDGGICQICGGICDWSDIEPSRVGALYPTIDHIRALANGGSHTWENVQLAHHICNSTKRDLTPEEMAEEVKRHAKKQTA